MNWLIVTPEQQIALDALNEAHPYQKCTSLATADGTLVTTADKIGVDYWADWQDWLNSLTPLEGNPVWPTPTADSVDTPPQT
jgi:hypothetical protein